MTGASGVGKTTFLESLQRKYSGRTDIVFRKFDDVGVPSLEEMNEKFSWPAEWQRITTQKWIHSLLYEEDAPIIFLEWQVNIDFIYAWFAEYDFTNFQIILITCTEDEMLRRLTDERWQPELATGDMRKWRRLLTEQAWKYGVPLIDTTHRDEKEILREFQKIISPKLI